MRVKLLIALLFALPLAAQQYTLGTNSDGCTGGTAYTIPATGATMRYGDFSCLFAVPADGLYQVTMAIQEPCIGVCNPPVTGPRQRAQNVYLNDSQVLSGLDPYAAGSISSTVAATRTALVFSAALKIQVRVQTVLRAGVLSAVTIVPFAASSAQISRQQCVGSGTSGGLRYDCAGIEFWAVTVGGNTRHYAVIPATDVMLGLPPCPAPPNSAVCVQPAAIGDPPLRMTASYNEPPMSINGYAVIPWNNAGVCPWLQDYCFGLDQPPLSIPGPGQ